MANKSVVLKFRVTPEEQKVIQAKAQKSNMKLSRYLASSALEKEIFVFQDLKEFTHQLSKIGTNLNQLALLANQGKIKCADIGTVKKVLNEIWQSLTLLTQKTKRSKG